MSHFTHEKFKLQATKENISKVKNILEDISRDNELNLVSDKEICNRYGMSVFVLMGLESPKINPMGVVVQDNSLVVVVDYDYHYGSTTREETHKLFSQLQQRIIQLKRDEAMKFTQMEADRLRNNGVNVTVRVH